MAKNWKRACEKAEADLSSTNVLLSHAQFDLNTMRSELAYSDRQRSLACQHMMSAADQFEARGVITTAELLRREAVRLQPPARPMTGDTESA